MTTVTPSTDTAVPVVATPATEKPLEEITRRLYGYMDTLREGKYRDYGVRFTATGYMRLASIVGYIVGVAEGGNVAFAEALAKDLVEMLDSLSKYGGVVPGTFSLPYYITELRDDGTKHGWSFTRYIAASAKDCDPAVRRLLKDEDGKIVKKVDFSSPRYEAYRYMYNSNGALLYHGPGGAETYSVLIGQQRDKFWYSHT